MIAKKIGKSVKMGAKMMGKDMGKVVKTIAKGAVGTAKNMAGAGARMKAVDREGKMYIPANAKQIETIKKFRRTSDGKMRKK